MSSGIALSNTPLRILPSWVSRYPRIGMSEMLYELLSTFAPVMAVYVPAGGSFDVGDGTVDLTGQNIYVAGDLLLGSGQITAVTRGVGW